MVWFFRRRLRKLLDFDRLERAIEAAEARTSGEIRVSIAPWFWGNVERAADRAFVRLGMTRTRERNGILFFVVPARRTFVVLGDRGIHERVGQAFWDSIAEELAQHFRRREFTEGLLAGIASAAEQLALHFPHHGARDQNELTNEIDIAD
jgi:uncharacterized membrane protein